MAKVLVEAALANRDAQQLVADPAVPYTEESVRLSPDVRVEYEQAYAIGELGTCLRATASKHWGEGPNVMPLEVEDPVDWQRILYVFRENSLYNRRFEQRMRLKELLGRPHRRMVERAKSRYCTKGIFLDNVTEEEAEVIRRVLQVEPGEFWRAVRGKVFLDLPWRQEQTYFDFMADD